MWLGGAGTAVAVMLLNDVPRPRLSHHLSCRPVILSSFSQTGCHMILTTPAIFLGLNYLENIIIVVTRSKVYVVLVCNKITVCM